jgi:hypothetical protein
LEAVCRARAALANKLRVAVPTPIDWASRMTEAMGGSAAITMASMVALVVVPSEVFSMYKSSILFDPPQCSRVRPKRFSMALYLKEIAR